MDIDDVAPRDNETDRTEDLGELSLPRPEAPPAGPPPAGPLPAGPPPAELLPAELLPAGPLPDDALPDDAPPPGALPPSMQPTTLLPVVPRRRSVRFTVTVASLAALAVAGLVALVIGVVSPDTPDGTTGPGLGVLTDQSSGRSDRGGLAGSSRPARPSASCAGSPCPSASRSRRPSASARANGGAQEHDDGAESPASPDATPSDKATGGVLSANYMIVATGSSTTLHGRLTVINGSGMAQAWSAQLSYVSGIQVNSVAPGMYMQLGSQVTVTPPTLLPAGQTLVVEINATRPADAATAPVSCAVNGRTCG